MPSAAPATATPKPTVERVASRESALMIGCEVVGHALFAVHTPSRRDLSSKARMPNAVPTPAPTAARLNERIGRVRFRGDGDAVARGSDGGRPLSGGSGVGAAGTAWTGKSRRTATVSPAVTVSS